MTPEACAERRASLGAAAIGRLDAAEQIALQAHLEGCAVCRRELAELTAVAALVATVDPDRVTGNAERVAPPGLVHDIVDRVSDARSAQVARHARRRRGALGAVAVGLAAAIVVGVLVRVGTTDHPSAQRSVALRGANATATATIIDAPDGTDVTFHGRGADHGDRYWLWLTDASGHRLAAATFWGGRDGTFAIRGHGAISYASVRRVWVTDQDNKVVLDSVVGAATTSG